MNWEALLGIAAIVGVMMTGGGLIWTWKQNGKAERDEFTELKTEVRGVRDDLADKNTGLGALSKQIGEVKNHCSGVTSAFAERLAGHDREIKEVKGRLDRKTPS